MAYCTPKTKKDGSLFYEITARDKDGNRASMRWDVKPTWSQKYIDRELPKVADDFEQKVKSGEIKPRKIRKQEEANRQAEAAMLKTVKDYINSVFMPAKEINIRENTRASYRMNIDKHILPVLGAFLMKDVTSAMITKLLIDFQKQGKSHQSCVKLYNVVNAVFQMAFLDDTIAQNPMLKVKRPAPRKDEKIVDEAEKAYTPDEVNQILAYAWDDYEKAKAKLEAARKEGKRLDGFEKWCMAAFRWYVFANLAIDTGARRGELCGLKWEDFDWRQSNVTIVRNVQYTPSKGIYIDIPKNKKSRIVDIGDETVRLLKELKKRQASFCLSKWVFTREGSQDVLNPQTVSQYFRRFRERHNLDDLHAHKFRHTSASIGITSGADIASVSARLGHKDTAVTLRMYTHANQESIRRAGQTVRDALKPKKETDDKTA